jgi:hypothetical protein
MAPADTTAELGSLWAIEYKKSASCQLESAAWQINLSGKSNGMHHLASHLQILAL